MVAKIKANIHLRYTKAGNQPPRINPNLTWQTFNIFSGNPIDMPSGIGNCGQLVNGTMIVQSVFADATMYFIDMKTTPWTVNSITQQYLIDNFGTAAGQKRIYSGHTLRQDGSYFVLLSTSNTGTSINLTTCAYMILSSAGLVVSYSSFSKSSYGSNRSMALAGIDDASTVYWVASGRATQPESQHGKLSSPYTAGSGFAYYDQSGGGYNGFASGAIQVSSSASGIKSIWWNLPEDKTNSTRQLRLTTFDGTNNSISVSYLWNTTYPPTFSIPIIDSATNLAYFISRQYTSGTDIIVLDYLNNTATTKNIYGVSPKVYIPYSPTNQFAFIGQSNSYLETDGIIEPITNIPDEILLGGVYGNNIYVLTKNLNKIYYAPLQAPMAKFELLGKGGVVVSTAEVPNG